MERMEEKKEIGTLIELLNEYNCKVLRHTDKWKEKSGRLIMEIDDNHSRSFNSDLYIVSLRYGFIKWLVENDKIDLEKLEKKVLKENLIRKFDEGLLMLLAIQDEPIRFLCDMLK